MCARRAVAGEPDGTCAAAGGWQPAAARAMSVGPAWPGSQATSADWTDITRPGEVPEVNRRWTATDAAHDEGGLKHWVASETRRVPIPPEVIAILRVHIGIFGVTPDGRIFSSDRGHPFASTAISDVWAEARTWPSLPPRSLRPWGVAPTSCATRRSRSG